MSDKEIKANKVNYDKVQQGPDPFVQRISQRIKLIKATMFLRTHGRDSHVLSPYSVLLLCFVLISVVWVNLC